MSRRTRRCPVCRAAFIYRDASMCRTCFDKSRARLCPCARPAVKGKGRCPQCAETDRRRAQWGKLLQFRRKAQPTEHVGPRCQATRCDFPARVQGRFCSIHGPQFEYERMPLEHYALAGFGRFPV
jgi:hypothetical protein